MPNPKKIPEFWGTPKIWGGFFAFLGPKNWDLNLGYPRNLGTPKIWGPQIPQKPHFWRIKGKTHLKSSRPKVEVVRDLVLIGSCTGTSRSMAGAWKKKIMPKAIYKRLESTIETWALRFRPDRIAGVTSKGEAVNSYEIAKCIKG